MSQLPMRMVKPPGLGVGHTGLGAARELFLEDLEEHYVHYYLPYARHSMAAGLHLLWGVDHHVPDSHAVDIQVDHHLDVHAPDNRVVDTLVDHHLDVHAPDSHAVDIQVGHHLDGVELALHGPDSVHHGPGVAHHHGHPVEVPYHVHHHAVEELSQLAVRIPGQKLLKTPQNSLQDQFFSS